MLESKHIPSEYTELLMDVKQTESNIDIDNELTVFPPEDKVFSNSRTTVFPILGGGERLEQYLVVVLKMTLTKMI